MYNKFNEWLHFLGMHIIRNNKTTIVDKYGNILIQIENDAYDKMINEKNIKLLGKNMKINSFIENEKYYFEFYTDKLLYKMSYNQISSDKIDKLSITTINRDDKFDIKKFNISDDGFAIEIDNSKNNNKRIIIAKNDKYNPILFLDEKLENHENTLNGNINGIIINRKQLIGKLEKWQYNKLANNLILHPRNKELIVQTLRDINSHLNGINDLIKNNFTIYYHIMKTDYKKDPIAEALISKVTNNEKFNTGKKLA